MGLGHIYSGREMEDESAQVPWRGRDAFYVTLLYLLSVLFLSCPLSGASGSGVELLVLLPLGLITLIWTRMYRSSGLLLGSRFRFGLGALAGGTFAGMLALLLELAFALAILRILRPGLLESSDELIGHGNLNGDPILILTVVVVGPVIEELFFRGLLLQGLQRSLGRTTAIAGSAVLFGIAHLADGFVENVISIGNGVLVGLLLGWLFVRYENLGITIAAHATINAGALLLFSAAG